MSPPLSRGRGGGGGGRSTHKATAQTRGLWDPHKGIAARQGLSARLGRTLGLSESCCKAPSPAGTGQPQAGPPPQASPGRGQLTGACRAHATPSSYLVINITICKHGVEVLHTFTRAPIIIILQSLLNSPHIHGVFYYLMIILRKRFSAVLLLDSNSCRLSRFPSTEIVQETVFSGSWVLGLDPSFCSPDGRWV